MVQERNELQFELKQTEPHQYQAVVSIPAPIVNKLYQEALLAQKNDTHTYGFSKGTTPLYYIEQNFKTNVADHLKEFIFHYFVVGFLYKNIYLNKLALTVDPTLVNINLAPNQDAKFHFLLESIAPQEVIEWQHLIFKAPQRKNYKDIDRQVESFVALEQQLAKEYQYAIGIGDWVGFEIHIVDQNNKALFEEHSEFLWLKIGEEEADKDLQELFCGRKIDDCFYTRIASLQEYFSEQIDLHYRYHIAIRAIVPNHFFQLDALKHHFNLKNSRDINKKLIEVFSYRNDLSQRRETIEALFKLLFTHQDIDLPQYIIERKRQLVLDAVHQNPDYLVYKAQADFNRMVERLAEKQLKEAVLVDMIAYNHKIDASMHDVWAYLTCMQRPRTKDFVHFDFPVTKRQGQEMPMSHSVMRYMCLREKTINYILHALTKRK